MAIRQPETNLADASLEPDPLSKLHKMSITAGMANQQYVAVNIAAVIAAMLGIASAMSIFSPLLLVLPAVGIIVAVAAWRQINDSNGTETGKLFALTGLALSLLMGGGVLGKAWVDNARARDDAKRMDSVMQQLSEAVKTGKFELAHDLFDISFRTRVPLVAFQARWGLMQKPEAYGPLQSIAWNDVLPQYEKMEGETGEVGVINFVIKFERSEGRYTFVFRKVDDAWKILGAPELFPAERAPKQ